MSETGSYYEKSRQRDFDQHASKIRLGLQKLTNEDAKRAIWELFQNAVDLSSKCHIRIHRTNLGLKFEHNGKPFDEDSFACLIKQVTNKDQGSTEEQVGQYGSGFITTHIYGKRIEIDGCVQIDTGFVPLHKFLIDRKESENELLWKKIQEQDKNAAWIIDEGRSTAKPVQENPWTSFVYLADNEVNFANIDMALSYLPEILPLVFIFHDNLSIVELIDITNKKITFCREIPTNKDSYSIVRIKKDNEYLSFMCLFSSDQKKSIRLVLPYDEDLNSINSLACHPKYFLFYPLIGTEKNGLNFIIHAHNFSPTEPRDNLYLKVENDDIKINVEKNQDLLTEAIDILLDFLRNHHHLIKDTFAVSDIRVHDHYLDVPSSNELTFIEREKTRLVNGIIHLEILKTNAGRIPLAEACFLGQDLLHSPDHLKSIHNTASQFWDNIPLLDEIVAWSELVAEWGNEDIVFLSIERILEEIDKTKKLSLITNKADLKYFLEYVNMYSISDHFNKYEVLPNIYGDFKFFEILKESEKIDKVLIEIAEILFNDVPTSFIDTDFKLDKAIPRYTREMFKSDMYKKVSEIVDHLLESNDETNFEEIRALLAFCNINKTTEINKALCSHFNTFYEQDPVNSDVENHVKDFDYRGPLKVLFRYFINDIAHNSIEWLKAHLDTLTDALQIVYENDDFKRTLLHELKAFPNQNFILCSQQDLKKDANIPETLKEIYLKISKTDIKNSLVLPEAVNYLSHEDEIKPEFIGQKLENIFLNERTSYLPISAHPCMEQIIEIIELISDESLSWGNWFPILNASKEEVMMGKIADPALRHSMFSILTKDDSTISILGELANNSNLVRIIELGKEALLKEENEHSNFQHKKALGTHIEKILRERLTCFIPESIEAEVKDEQDGQDIIIRICGIVMYYIEVKSIWDPKSSIRMSVNQTVQAIEKKHMYSLCSVDMSENTSPNREKVDSVEEIRNEIRFVTDIGDHVAYLFDVLQKTKEPETVHIVGDYRTLIPKKTIDKEGISLLDFETHLVNYLNNQKDALNLASVIETSGEG